MTPRPATSKRGPFGDLRGMPNPLQVDHAHKKVHLTVTNDRQNHSINAVPKELQQAYVLEGYRWNLTVAECAASLFTLHNDTLNVWTHLLGALYFLYMAPVMLADMPANATTLDCALMLMYIFCAFACHGLSAAYHTFKASDEDAFHAWYRLDLTGIVVLIAGSSFVGFYNAFYCKPWLTALYCIPQGTLLTAGMYFTHSSAFRGHQYDVHRTLTLASSVAIGIFPISHWLLWECWDHACHSMALNPAVTLGCCYAAGFVFFYFKVPERWFPGQFDIWFSSHQIWHVFVFAAACAWLHGMHDYFHFRLSTPGDEYCEAF